MSAVRPAVMSALITMTVLAPKNRLPLSDIQARAVAAYWGMSIGDALGATVEFMTPREIQHQYQCHREIIGGGWLNLKAGQVTDDTEMSLALGNAILHSGQVDPSVVAQHFSDWMATKPVDMGATVRRGLVRFRKTGKTAVALDEYNAGNGACMRTLPIALFGLGMMDEELARCSKAQAHITHNNPLSDIATLTIIHMVQAAILGKGRAFLKQIADELTRTHPVFSYEGKREENPSGYIVDTIRAVFQAFFETDSFESCLIDVVNRGGDADTTGAIAGMLAGAFYGTANLPKSWLSSLEDKVKDACETQALSLVDLCEYCPT